MGFQGLGLRIWERVLYFFRECRRVGDPAILTGLGVDRGAFSSRVLDPYSDV
jgi:hypothetical protein